MLIEFSVGNYRSFHQPVTLSMQATSLKHSGDIDKHNVFRAGKYELLRSAAVYGANASGKSNLIRAMMFMRRFVRNSSTRLQEGDPTGVERFTFHMDARQEPAYFQIIFLLEGVRYRYGFELDEERVHAEWLYRTRQRETRLFVRERQEFDISGPFKKEATGLEAKTRENALFLSTLAQFNSSTAIMLLAWFRQKFKGISGLNDSAYGGYTLHRFEAEGEFRRRARELLRLADVGITDISMQKLPLDRADIPTGLRDKLIEIAQEEGELESELLLTQVQTLHPLFDGELPIGTQPLDFKEESEGTRKFFFLLGPLLDTLENGNVLAIDELEARLHPRLTREIVHLFNSPRINLHNAQLVFATHDAGLLGACMLRRDQVWFTEKNQYGATDLYSLAEMKVRKDALPLLDKNYLAGRYGAIPFVGGLRAFIEQEIQHGEKTETERA